ncbi:signal peptidase I [Desulfurococcaceae archaeon MEX13E-LK6-19]|nr:signal peptidase I [Desulfurococcaceae archaeon MEX13E-LK6-19]
MKKITTTIILLFISAYMLQNLQVLYGLTFYVIPSIIWIIMFVTFIATNSAHDIFEQKEYANVISFMLLAGLIPWYAAGIYFGFGFNLLAVMLFQYIVYIVYRISYVISLEVLRNIFIKKMSYLWINQRFLLLVSLATTLLSVSLSKLEGLEIKDIPELMVLFSQNLILTIIAWRYGFKAQLFFSIPYTTMIKLVPIMPDLTGVIRWLLLVFISLLQASIFYVYNVVERKTSIGIDQVTGSFYKAKISKFVNIVNKILLIGAIIFMVGFFVGYRAIVVASNSMQPTLSRGDIVVININDLDANKGDVIVFIVGNKMIIHRVIASYQRNGEQMYITQGDANDAPDPWVLKKENIVGKQVFTIPHMGYPSLLFSGIFESPVTGIGVTITFILGLFIIYILRDVVTVFE